MTASHLRLALLAAVALLVVALSGCITVTSSTGGDPGPEVGHEPAKQAEAEGIITTPYDNVHLALTIPDDLRPGDTETWEMTVRHKGPAGDEPFPYSSVCHSPWQVRLYDGAGLALAWSEPIAECEAYGTKFLEPGDSLGTMWQWDVRSWDAESERYEDLPAGDYRLEFTFERQNPDAGREPGPIATHLFTIA